MRYASGGNNNTNNTNNTNINDLFITSSNNQQQQIKNRAKKAKKGKKAKKAKKNFYEILGVEPSATKTEIKRAYYDLARTMHPDANPDDPNAAAAFNALSRAYHVLSDDVRRTAYDASGYNEEESRRADGSDTADLDGSAGLGPGGLSVYEQLVRGNVDAFGLGRLLRRITARGPTTTSSSSSSSSSGSEASGHRNAVTVTVPVTFAEAVAGVRKTVRAGLRVRCPRCGGAGEIVAQDEAPRPCRRCGGSGTAPGAKDISVPCRWCGGSGRMQPPRCGACRGSGARWARDARIAVNVPQGADDGDVVQVALPEELNALDAVFAQVAVVKKHPLFRRAGMDLHVDAPVSLTTAALGGSIKVPLLDGTHKSVRVKINK